MKKLIGLLIVLTVFGADLLLNPASAWGDVIPATPPTPPVIECNQFGDYVLNYNFECGKDNWEFHQGDGRNKFEVLDASGHGKVGYVKIGRLTDNIQLYQRDINLSPNTQYKLSFDAKSNRNRKLPVYLHKHAEPYTNYGIEGYKFDLSTSWNNYTLTFTTTGFTQEVDDARPRFWLKNFSQVGDEVWIDNVKLSELAEDKVVQTMYVSALSDSYTRNVFNSDVIVNNSHLELGHLNYSDPESYRIDLSFNLSDVPDPSRIKEIRLEVFQGQTEQNLFNNGNKIAVMFDDNLYGVTRIIISDNNDVGWKKSVMTDEVIQDITNGRSTTDFILRPLFVTYGGFVRFESSENSLGTGNTPRLVVEYYQ